ncbi:Fe-S cluster assembly protein HesB [Patescibacteria group bacterium]
MKKISNKQIQVFQSKIFDWWVDHKRDLPWRDTHDPYYIFVSEMMLQQTQVSRVIEKYQYFIRKYPLITDIAMVSLGDVIKEWQGLGYNRRAKYLKETCTKVVHSYNGIFPKDEDILCTLPGVGTYTARAIMVFSYKIDIAMIDTNIRQIITHYFYDNKLQKESDIQNVAEQILPIGKSWEWHQALMDFSAQNSFSIQKNVSKKSMPFKNTKRFYRGRIIDRLRKGKCKEKVLSKEYSKLYTKTKKYHMQIIEDLEHEGLIKRSSNGIISLP